VLIKITREDMDELIDTVDYHLTTNPNGFQYPTMLRLAQKLRRGRQTWAARGTDYVKAAISQPECYILLDMITGYPELHQEILMSYGRAVAAQFQKELNKEGYEPIWVERDPGTGDFRRKAS